MEPLTEEWTGEIGTPEYVMAYDFGAGFSEGMQFFSAGIEPKRVNGAGDYFELLFPQVSC